MKPVLLLLVQAFLEPQCSPSLALAFRISLPLFPLASLITPNTSEASLLLATRALPSEIASLEDMLAAAKHLRQLGPAAVLVKGGHLTATPADVERVSAAHHGVRVVRDGVYADNMEILQVAEAQDVFEHVVVDVLQDAEGTTLFLNPRIDSTSTHGTGCTLSAAIICGLSRGQSCESCPGFSRGA